MDHFLTNNPPPSKLHFCTFSYMYGSPHDDAVSLHNTGRICPLPSTPPYVHFMLTCGNAEPRFITEESSSCTCVLMVQMSWGSGLLDTQYSNTFWCGLPWVTRNIYAGGTIRKAGAPANPQCDPQEEESNYRLFLTHILQHSEILLL